MQFRPLTDDDLALCRPYFEKLQPTACDYTVGGVFMWREMYNTQMAIEEDCLIVCLYEEGDAYYCLPMGERVESAVKKILEYEKAKGTDVVRFCAVMPEYLPIFEGLEEKVEVIAQFDFNDYLYSAEDLIGLAGKKYGGQRNLIRQFERLYPNNEFKELTPKNLQQVKEFFAASFKAADPMGEDHKQAENSLVSSVLSRDDLFGMFGAVLYVDGNVVGFSVGEQVGDTLYVHIEKADRNVKGAYQTLNNRFARKFGGNASFINREDDMGDLGLRKAKMAYHPIKLIEKYIVEIKL